MNKNNMKKIMIIITLIDIVIIAVFLKVLTVNNIAINKNSGVNVSEKGSTVVEDSANNQSIKSSPVDRIEEDYNGTIEDNILDLYKKKIVGSWHISQNMTFCFSKNGSYSGFFDSRLNNVSDYIYQCIINKEGNPALYIYNKEKSLIVMYTLQLNDANNIVLHFDTANIDIELKKENR